MTKDKFKMLCEQVLIPRLGDFMRFQLTDLHETLEIIERELARVGKGFDRIEAHLDKKAGNDDHAG